MITASSVHGLRYSYFASDGYILPLRTNDGNIERADLLELMRETRQLGAAYDHIAKACVFYSRRADGFSRGQKFTYQQCLSLAQLALPLDLLIRLLDSDVTYEEIANRDPGVSLTLWLELWGLTNTP